jgi:dephospho-CoA kinase
MAVRVNHVGSTSVPGLARRPVPKLVFAPPAGERASNVHVVEAASEAARRKLLFRDFLRAHGMARDAWADFKQRLAAMAADSYQYGQAKAGPPRS